MKGERTGKGGRGSMDERAIIDLYLDRDENAIAQTREQYEAALLALSSRILGNPEDAEETANDTYFECWNRIPPNKPYGYLRPFVLKIARHLSFDRLRARNAGKRSAEITELTREMEECLPSHGTTEDLIDGKLLFEAVNGWLRGLSAEKRVFFIRRYFFAESIREIADRTGAKESRVKVTLYRTREALREFLEKEGYEI